MNTDQSSEQAKAIAALSQGDTALASHLFSQCLSSIHEPRAQFAAAVAFKAERQYPLALDMLKRLHDAKKQTPETIDLHAEILLETEQPALAANLLGHLINNGQSSTKRLLRLVQALFDSFQITAALSVIESIGVVEDSQASAQLALLEGRCKAALNRYSEAAQSFSRAANTSKSVAPAATYRLARLASREGAFQKAEDLFATIDMEGRDGSVVLQARVANAIHSGQADLAESLLADSLSSDSDLELLQMAADFAIERGKEEPNEIWEQAWLAQGSPALFRSRHERLLRRGDVAEAEAWQSRYADERGSDQHFEWAMLNTLIHKKNYECAKEEVEGSSHKELLKEPASRIAFANGDYEQALFYAQALCRERPSDQYHHALLVTALRCLEDPRYEALIDHSQLVHETSLDCFDDNTYCASVIEALNAKHFLIRAPLMQSVKAGTQTPGHLFTEKGSEALVQLEQFINQASLSFFEQLHASELQEKHPIRLLRPADLSMRTSWSIRAQGETFHRSHVHNRGWYSGGLYVETPEAINDASDAGYIVFGVPSFDVKDRLEPTLKVKPEPGKLLLFPSYFWHMTKPFEASGTRLMIAFDYGAPDTSI